MLQRAATYKGKREEGQVFLIAQFAMKSLFNSRKGFDEQHIASISCFPSTTKNFEVRDRFFMLRSFFESLTQHFNTQFALKRFSTLDD